jgi:hypothetical protein
MDERTIALGLAVGRAALGAGLLLAPERVNTPWVGTDGERPGARVLGRAVGARDIALGLGVAAALRQGASARPWLLAGLLADLADLGSTLAARGAMPRNGVIGVGALAGGSALVGGWLAQRLP